MHRIYCDLIAGTAKPVSVEVFDLNGGTYYKAYDGSLRPVDGEKLFSGERSISTGWHASQADAYAEAADELARRVRAVAALRLTCRAAAEVLHV
jgi:hypothetical protein